MVIPIVCEDVARQSAWVRELDAVGCVSNVEPGYWRAVVARTLSGLTSVDCSVYWDVGQ